MFGSATRRSFLSTFVLALSLCSVATADHTFVKRHHSVNRIDYASSATTIAKRTDNAKFTYYSTGQGACGAESKDSDFIVAMNSAQYSGGDHCFKHISISYNGKTADATVVDECPGCPDGGLDLSPGLFQYFASEDAGVIYGSWEFK